MRVLLTGSTGTLGRNLVRLLQAQPEVELLLPGRADLENPLPPADILIHAAANGLRYPRPPFSEMAEFNVAATLRLFESAPAAHFVFISSGLAYKPQGRPLTEEDPLESLNPYAATKAAADLLLRSAASSAGRRLTVVRPFSFTGLDDGGGRLFPALLEAALHKRPFPMSPGGQIRDFCAVQDVAAGVWAAALRGPDPPVEVFNIGSGIPASIKGIVEDVCQALSLAVELRFGDRPYPPQEPMHLVADTAKASRLLGWRAQTDLSYAVWQLAQTQFPDLKVRCPQ